MARCSWSRAALALQLAAEGKSPPAELNALAREVAARFDAVEIELNGGKPPAEDVKATPPRPRRGRRMQEGDAGVDAAAAVLEHGADEVVVSAAIARGIARSARVSGGRAGLVEE